MTNMKNLREKFWYVEPKRIQRNYAIKLEIFLKRKLAEDL